MPKRVCGYLGRTKTPEAKIKDFEEWTKENYFHGLLMEHKDEALECADKIEDAIKILDNYISAISSGTVNGYGYIDSLHEAAVEILCRIISAMTDVEASTRDDIKEFTTGNDAFLDEYAKNAINAYGDIVNDIKVYECKILLRRLS